MTWFEDADDRNRPANRDPAAWPGIEKGEPAPFAPAPPPPAGGAFAGFPPSSPSPVGDVPPAPPARNPQSIRPLTVIVALVVGALLFGLGAWSFHGDTTAAVHFPTPITVRQTTTSRPPSSTWEQQHAATADSSITWKMPHPDSTDGPAPLVGINMTATDSSWLVADAGQPLRYEVHLFQHVDALGANDTDRAQAVINTTQGKTAFEEVRIVHGRTEMTFDNYYEDYSFRAHLYSWQGNVFVVSVGWRMRPGNQGQNDDPTVPMKEDLQTILSSVVFTPR